MIRKAFRMRIYEGQAAEYKRRHDEIWDEMKDMIRSYGGHNYAIYLDEETCMLYANIELEDEERWAKSADDPTCRKWWDYMADIMETNPDNSPVSVDLTPVFYLK